jgi:hypothetical protein
MPDLPTITVTAAQATRMLAAFGSVANYKEWLRGRVVEEVQRFETRQIDEQAHVDKRTRLAEIEGALPKPPETAPVQT